MTAGIGPQDLKKRIREGGELAILDVREEGAFARGHLLFARSLPFGRIELRVRELVPRFSTPIVLCAGADGLADGAAERLSAFGYGDLAILEGGVAAWEKAGFVLFGGVFVPSKAFGEFVETAYQTDSISAPELKKMLDAGEDVLVLDSRPYDEYRRMSIPTGIDAPGAELAYRVHDLVHSPETLVVVNCAGRTRSIIGAQSLINACLDNKVVALKNGTMGWRLAGFALDHGKDRRAPDPSPRDLRRPARRPGGWRPVSGSRPSIGRRSMAGPPNPTAGPCSSSTFEIPRNISKGICRARSRPRAANWCRRPIALSGHWVHGSS